MESYKTDDVTLELSTIIEEISETDYENAKIPHTGSKSPAIYKQIMRTKFPPNSPNFVKPEKNTNNSIDPRIIDTVAGLNIYSRQILTIQEVDKITCYYPQLDILHPTTSDKEKNVPDQDIDKDVKDNVVPSSNIEQNSEVRVSSFENDGPNEKNVKKPQPYFDAFIEPEEEEKLIPPLNKEENRDVKSKEESNVREDEIPKSSYFSPCCLLIRSDSKNGLSEETEYEPKTIENDPETDFLEGDMENEKMSIDNNEENELLNEMYEYDKFISESEEEQLLISEDTESDMSNMSNEEEKGLLGQKGLENIKSNTDNEMTSNEKRSLKSAESVKETDPNAKQESLESSKYSDINLMEQNELNSNSNSQNEANKNQEPEIYRVNLEEHGESGDILGSKNYGHDKHESSDPSNKTLDEKKECDPLLSFQITPLDSIEDQDNILSANDTKKKKSSLLKRLFSRKRK